MSTIIESIEQRQLRKDIPRFKAGDTVRVHFQVIEGTRRRVQVFEGVVIKRQGSGARETFTVRKQSFGIGVERTFPVHSPKIEKIEVGAVGDVNRAKLYYLREKVGKKARVRELRQTPAQVAATKAEAEAAKAAIAADAADVEAAAAAEAEAVEAEAAAEAEATAEVEAAAAADLEPVEVEEALVEEPVAEEAPAEEPVAEAEAEVEPEAVADEPGTRLRRTRLGRTSRPTTRPLTRSRSALFLTASRSSPPAVSSRTPSRKMRARRCRNTCARSAPTRATTPRTFTARMLTASGSATSRRTSSRAPCAASRAAATGSSCTSNGSSNT